ncbi:cadherin-related family member 3-like [Gastrophryne carolinensis]
MNSQYKTKEHLISYTNIKKIRVLPALPAVTQATITRIKASISSSCKVVSAAPELNMPSNVTIPEDAPPSTLVAQITASISPAFVLYDKLVGGPYIINSNPVVHPFTIIAKANHWELITKNHPKLDAKAVPLYTLQIRVKDSKGTTVTGSIVIDITKVNQAPMFTGTLAMQDAELYVAENTPVSTAIYEVAAKDPDNDQLQYSIRTTPGNTGFLIDNQGTITTTQMFDYESNTKSYTITVNISDGVLSDSANIRVYITNVNDNDPSLTCVFSSITEKNISTKAESSGNSAYIQLIEELPAGTTVNTCTASDADQMNDLTFSLDPANNYFSIHQETGTVIIMSRMDSEAVGFVSVQSYTVKVCDRDNRCASIPVTAAILPINDNPPFCDPYLYSFTNPETILKDTVVATLSCHDPDVPPNALTYLSSSGPIGAGKLFQQISSNSHIIKVNQNLVYDTDPVTTYEMAATVSDSSDTTHTVTTTIIVSVTPVNNYNPVFNPTTYSFTVRETARGGTVLGRVTATDEDRPNCVTYSIRDGSMDDIHRFWINPKTGSIELLTTPDFETKSSFTMTIEATDCDPINPLKALATVTVNILEENDEAPVCKPSKYEAVTYENVTSGVNINNFRLFCTDRDSNDTAMRFDIVSGNTNNHFAFDPTHGSNNPKLIVKSPFDFDSGADRQEKYTLMVHITDDNDKNGPPQQRMTGTVMVTVNVIRTNSPVSPTTDYYNRQGVTIVYKDVNTFDPSAWYVPFLLTLMALLLAALLAWACHLLWKYTNLKQICQKARNKMSKSKRCKKETTTYAPVFNGEAVDPVSGNTYQYNSRSGARRWKPDQVKDDNVKLTDIATVSEALPVNPSAVTPVKVT